MRFKCLNIFTKSIPEISFTGYPSIKPSSCVCFENVLVVTNIPYSPLLRRATNRETSLGLTFLLISHFFTSPLNLIRYSKILDNLNSPKKILISYLGTSNNFKPHLNLKSNFNRIFSCSNIYPNKRVHLIASSILKSKSIIEWDHYGEYMSFTSDSYKENLEYIKDQLIKFNFKLNFPGRISNNEILEALNENNYDFHINLSESEGVPVSIMESFSFGIPVIATNVGGISEIVIDGYNGFLINPNSTSSDVSQIINKFYTLKLNEINDLRNNAFLTWKKKFNADSNYKLLINQIESL